MIQTIQPAEFFQSRPAKHCAECGSQISEHTESALMECDYCLSKKDEV